MPGKRKAMKILVFTTLFPNEQMPLHALFIKRRVNALARMHEVVVVSPIPMSPPGHWCHKWSQFRRVPLEAVIDGIKVYYPRYFLMPKIGRCFYGMTMYLSVKEYVRRLHETFQFDMIDGHFVYPDGYAAVCLAKALGLKVVLNARGTDVNWYPRQVFSKPFVRRALSRADGLIAVSQNLKEKMQSIVGGQLDVRLIPNGIDRQLFYAMKKSEARRVLGLGQERRILLSVGQLLESKGFHVLIEALGRLKMNNVDLFIIGEGPYRSQLEKYIRAQKLNDQVYLLGAKPQNELNYWYNAADVFCLTSYREGRPNVVMESLSVGTPVITMQGFGLDDILRSGGGFVLSQRDPSLISSTIRSVLQTKWDQQSVSQTVKDFDWDKTARTVSDYFEEVRRKENILFFSSDDWHSGLKTSKFHLSTRLARANKVVFVNSLSLRTPALSKRDMGKIINKLAGFLKGAQPVRKNLFVYTPLLFPFQRYGFVRLFNKSFLTWQFKFLLKKFNMRKPLIWSFLPNTIDLIQALPRKGLVYYCVDDMSAFNGVPQKLIQQQDQALTRLADVTFSVSKELFEKKKQLNPRSYYSPHGVDFDLFHQAITHPDIPKPDDIKNLAAPIIGFYGLISSDWVDFQLVRYLADQQPDWSFVFIGKIDKNPDEQLPSQKNIHYLSVKPYEDLYKYSHFFDVAILPFNVNSLTIHSHPLKILEYLSSGKSVVSIDIPEVHKYEDVIFIAADYDQFQQGIKKGLKDHSASAQKKRIIFASNNSWETRFYEVQSIIYKHI